MCAFWGGGVESRIKISNKANKYNRTSEEKQKQFELTGQENVRVNGAGRIIQVRVNGTGQIIRVRVTGVLLKLLLCLVFPFANVAFLKLLYIQLYINPCEPC